LGGPFSVPPGFGQSPAPLAGLPGIPVDGGFSTVDAASHDVRASSPAGFTFDSGPARRYVGTLPLAGPAGVSSLPGGTSGLPSSPHYLDRLRPYLTNEADTVLMRLDDVARATESVERYLPAR
jgi:penicillin amidase